MGTSNRSAARIEPQSSQSDQQLHLLDMPSIHPKRLAYTIEQVRACADELAAIDLSIRCSGLLDKQIADAIGMDEGNWNKVKRGQRGFMPGGRLKFMRAVGNQILREWEEEALGLDSKSIRVHRSELEEQIEDRDRKIADHERTISVLSDLLTRKR